MNTPDHPIQSPIQVAPRPQRVQAAAAAQEKPTNNKLALYSNFLSDVALIDRLAPIASLHNNLQTALAQYTADSANSVRLNFVADGPKLRDARKLIMEDFNSDQKRIARNLETSSSRKRCVNNLAKYHKELDDLLGGRIWLPAGVAVESISYENILNIRKIVRWTKEANRDPASLWSPDGGELFGIKYTGRALSNIWARMSRQRVGQDQPDRGDEPRDSYFQTPPHQVGDEGDSDADQEDEPDVQHHVNGSIPDQSFDDDPVDDGFLDSSHHDERTNVNSVSLPTKVQQDARPNSRLSSPEQPRRARSSVDDIESPLLPLQTKPLAGNRLFLHDAAGSLARDTNPPSPPDLASFSSPRGIGHDHDDATLPILSPTTNLREHSTPSPTRPNDSPVPAPVNNSPQDRPSSPPIVSPRKRSRSASPEPAPKRQATSRPLPDAVPPTIPPAHFSVDSIAPGCLVDGTFIYHVLNMVVSLCPLSVQLVDPLLAIPDQPLPSKLEKQICSRPDSVILAPVNLTRISQHWVLAVASGNTISIFDSLPSATNDSELKARLHGVAACLKARGAQQSGSDGNESGEILYSWEACPRQTDGSSCGVAVMVNALCVVAGLDMPDDVPDYALWRRVLSAFATGDSIMSKGFFLPSSEPTRGLVLPASKITAKPPLPISGDITKEAFSSWKRSVAAYEASVKKALCEAHERHTLAKDTLAAAAELWASLCKVGTGLWSPRLRKTRKSTDFIDEIQADYARYSSAASSIRACADANPDMVRMMEDKMKELRVLQTRRTAVLSRVSAMSHALQEEHLAVEGQEKKNLWSWEHNEE
ncbi:uncharacterized protein CTRU02_215710 [Colletotrichum truncatum]|uniref:Uncharacterized protein n=1 Tax=Colletotrichum truncatum TaxID=5467 RepID=A0ACC3YBZ3_COLTU|nr:uncharacterized protein CTRU02_14917 [Colletotrichum truncatum]KAF6781619.1 hypothetical protein CTRU02_14917 [Colletotrichum truncatum]